MAARVSIQAADFDVAQEIAALRAGDARIGAVCSFIGTVRDRNDGSAVASMELEHYPGMTEKAIEAMIDEAQRRFYILGARVIHRIGLLQPQDQIMMVAVTSAHRGQAFQACEFLMDYLKTQAPFWKKEQTPEGARWVDARSSDDAAIRDDSSTVSQNHGGGCSNAGGRAPTTVTITMVAIAAAANHHSAVRLTCGSTTTTAAIAISANAGYWKCTANTAIAIIASRPPPVNSAARSTWPWRSDVRATSKATRYATIATEPIASARLFHAAAPAANSAR